MSGLSQHPLVARAEEVADEVSHFTYRLFHV